VHILGDAELIRSFAVFFLTLTINYSKLYKYHKFNNIWNPYAYFEWRRLEVRKKQLQNFLRCFFYRNYFSNNSA